MTQTCKSLEPAGWRCSRALPIQNAISSPVHVAPSQTTSPTTGLSSCTRTSSASAGSTVVRGHAPKTEADAAAPSAECVQPAPPEAWSCHSEAALYVASNIGCSSAFRARNAACRVTRRLTARCRAPTSRWRWLSRLLTIQSTVHPRGPSPQSQMRQGARSPGCPLSVVPAGCCVVSVRSTTSTKSSTSVHLSTSETLRALPNSRRTASASWMACMESRPCMSLEPWPPQMRSTSAASVAPAPLVGTALLVLLSRAAAGELCVADGLPAAPARTGASSSLCSHLESRFTWMPTELQALPPPSADRDTWSQRLPRSTTAAIESNSRSLFQRGACSACAQDGGRPWSHGLPLNKSARYLGRIW
mmetsp:Transcript_92007/g.237401  ORF Transcript_92007/g.237401 Transcript_92007/m.237401 type:complete len:361 (-) Transcript_92007:58-1140(-)